MLLLYILWDDWLIFMISGSNEQLQQQLEYTLLKLDCHSWWILKMQSGHEVTLEEWYAIKFCFKHRKNATEMYGMLQIAFGSSCMNRESVFEWHKRFKEGRESVRDDERCGRSKEVRTPELIGQIKNFMDKDHRVSIETINAQFDVSVGTVHIITREELKMQKIYTKFVPRCSEKNRKKDVVMTAGRWLSWSIQIPQFLMLWWPAMKAGSTAMTQRPTDQETEFPVEACWFSQNQKGQTGQIHSQTFDDPFFWEHWHDLHALGSHWTDSQQGILCWGFMGVQEDIPSEEASTLQIGSVAFPPGQCTRKMHKEKLRGCCFETIEEMKEAVTKVIDTLTQEDFHGDLQKLLEWYKCIAARERLLGRGLEFHVCTINKSAHTKKIWKLI